MHPALLPPPSLPPFMVANSAPPVGVTPEIEAYYQEVFTAIEAEKERVKRRAQNAATHEAQQITGWSADTLKRKRKRGLIRAYREPGTRAYSYNVGELEDAMASLARPADGRPKWSRRTSNPAHQKQKGEPVND